MILNIFSILDSKAEAFMQPFYAQTKGLAVRSFTEALNDSKSIFYKYPSEFLLYEVGTFDDKDCSITMHSPIQLIGNGSEFQKPVVE